MTTWLEDETGVESSQPREGIEIRYGIVRHLIATGSRNVEIDGNTYIASPAQRGAISVSFVGDGATLDLRLPASHALSQRWLAQVSPPRNVTVTVRRLQPTSGQFEIVWRGVITTCVARGHIVSFTGLATAASALQRQLSTVGISRSCPHILYDSNCRVPPAGAFRVATTVASHDGRTVRLASIAGHPDQWAQFGELQHVATGERMAVSSQVGTVLTLQLPIVGLATGDSVRLYAGCDHSIGTCASKFGNQVNYGGSPRSPRENPMIPGKNLGIVVQE